MRTFLVTCLSVLLLGGSAGLSAAPAEAAGLNNQQPTASSSFCWWFPYLPGCPRK